MRYSFLKTILFICAIGLLTAGFSTLPDASEEWISLFDGKSLDGWKASENPSTFSVEDGRIVADGPRSHLFYTGPVQNHNFKNFEFKADVMTTPGSNSGIYFHTGYQEEGWPSRGYEAQINNTSSDPRKTASLYAVDDVESAPVADDEWFTMYIKVEGKHIVIKVNDETMVDYTESNEDERPEGRDLSEGTFALQGHDPDSRVYFKNIMVKPLED